MGNGARSRHKHRQTSSSRGRKLAAAIGGVVLAGGAAFAGTNWIVGVNAGSSGEGQAATISNLTIAAVATPAAGNLLYPGANGDVVMKITNPNPYPVTITAIGVPANTAIAAGYTDSGLSSAIAGCAAATPSGVTWNTSYAGTSHALSSSVTVAAESGGTNGTLTVTLTNGATMATTAPSACAGAYFSLPALTGITATGGAATATTSPVTVS